LKQAGFEWSETLSKVLKHHGYLQSVYDPCLFYKRKGKDYIVMSIHVDDFYVISTQQRLIDKLHRRLESEFKSVSVKQGSILQYLGVQIKTSNGVVELSQPGYIEKILQKSGIDLSKTCNTPYVDRLKEKKDDNEAVDKTVYLELIGMINYLAILTRPDLLYSLSRCAQRCANPTKRDLRRVNRIFYYINATKEKALTFRKGKVKLTAWVDASHMHYQDSKAQIGYCFSLGENDGCFYSRSMKLKIVTPAGSTESEYVALFEAGTEAVFLSNLLFELGFECCKPVRVNEDNQSVIHMVHGRGKFHKSKHINIKYHYTKELIKDGVIEVRYCPTDENVADLFTKPLDRVKTKYFADRVLGLSD
jgi:hypothetical protein